MPTLRNLFIHDKTKGTMSTIPTQESNLPPKKGDQQSTMSTSQDEEKAQVDSPDDSSEAQGPDGYGPAPDGGLRAWLVAAGAACIFFSCLGFMNAFGVFQEYYMRHQLSDKTPDDIAWIGSFMAFIQFATGAIGGPMFDRYGAWVRHWHRASTVFVLANISSPNRSSAQPPLFTSSPP